jgi:hypothetical protein
MLLFSKNIILLEFLFIISITFLILLLTFSYVSKEYSKSPPIINIFLESIFSKQYFKKFE